MPYLFLCHASERGKCEWKSEISKCLLPIHETLSNWNPESSLSLLNTTHSLLSPPSLLLRSLSLANDIHTLSKGRFDIALVRLYSLWTKSLDSNGCVPPQDQIDSLFIDRFPSSRSVSSSSKSSLPFLYSNILQGNDHILSLSPHVSLDLNSLAKGAGVDLVSRFLEEKNVENYYFDF